METTKMKIEYRKQIDSETAPWQLLTNVDELIWNGVYALRVSDDDGSHNLPFSFANDDTVTVVVKDHSHEGMLENGRTIVQTITRVERSTGKVFVYTRTRCNVDNIPSWGYWTLATEGGAVIEIPQATHVSLGGVVVGDGLAVDATGKLTVAPGAVGEELLSPVITGRINVMEEKLQLADPLVVNDGVVLHTGSLVKNSTPYSGTTFRAYTGRIQAGGELLVANAGYVITACKVFDGEQETAFIDNLNECRYLLADKGSSYQFEFKKKDESSFAVDELSQVIKSFRRNPVAWNAGSNMDAFLAPGTYTISGTRANLADGLPIDNTGAIDARLVVLASEACVTQVLTLLNADGGDGNVYTRTRRKGKWTAWGRLQTNIEVGHVDSLDGFVDNGIYSGVWTTGYGNAGPLTFVCLVINDCALKTSPRRVSQFLYGLSKADGGILCKSRAGKGDNVTWAEWKDINEDSIKALVQGTGENSNGWREPFRRLQDVSTFQELVEGVTKDGVKTQLGLNDLHGTSAAATKDYIGCFRVSVNGVPVEVFSSVEGYATDRWSQVITTSRVLVNEVKMTEVSYNTPEPTHKYRKFTYAQKFEILNKYDNANVIKRYARNCNGGVWSDWREVGAHYTDSPNYGKRIALFGGSFAQNMAVNSTDFQFDYKGQKTNLLPYIADRLGATAFDDYAVGGQGMMAADKENGGKFHVPLIKQLQTAGTGYDVYIIMGGINDYGQNVPLGASNGAADDTTYCGGLKKAIDWIRSNNKSAKIYTVTPFKGYDNGTNGFVDRYWNPRTNIKNSDGHAFYEYIQAQKEVAQINGVPCFDLWANQQFSGASASEHYLSDLLHPNGKGYQAVADALVNFIAYGEGSGCVDFLALANPHIKQAIEQGRQQALRALFVAAGAEYNDSGADKTKTAPWGETVTHKAGHYYLNGLGDITEAQMMEIYKEKETIPRLWQGGFANHNDSVRTFLPITKKRLYDYKASVTLDFATDLQNLETVVFNTLSKTANLEPMLKIDRAIRFFTGCPKLKYVGYVNVSEMLSGGIIGVQSCPSLEYVNIVNLKLSLTLEHSPLISKQSICLMIANASPTAAITITLHPEAYARLADDAEIIAALEAQPLVSLVSA